jgi:NitT/TauT family transport system permease protein
MPPRWAARATFYVGLLVVWEAASRSGLCPGDILPGPLPVLEALAAGVRGGLFVEAALVSLYRIALGFGIALVLGVAVGLVLARAPLMDETLGTLVLGLQALPAVCWLPLAFLWFGTSEHAIVFVVVMAALASIALGVDAGVKDTPPLYLRAARNLGATGLALYTQVVLPAAKPAVLQGVKQGWFAAWRALMAAELLYYSLGLGNLLQAGRDLNDAARVIAVMLVIVAVGVAVDRIVFAPAERRIRERWGLAGA